ncbi:molybdenum cofactor biosynthesis protein B [Pseudogemmobacter blasticus]|uniref:Molybdenum cofactor biosynthesis protein B n=1 Tax=Fuscovulum blasticum DSM 2131 TaxID=1188250 RepID=A0A2T4J7R6_FUSBL|nr:molybdenum cofactor biosynthesis protein B [Fuscovulum blasticum]PTE13946.1 molybdenum cofactor biosynthesis protein B [Fuscovulum blasticum DSM 2131]
MGRIDETRDFIPVRIAVLTVSDTRKPGDDRSGDTLVERLTGAGHHLAARDIVTDDRDRIAARLRDWIADPGVDVILSTGGTGLTGRDVTVEAHRDVYEKEIEAFATVFTMVSMQKIGTSAVQSRATGGVAGGKYLFALPGSPGACRDAWDEILVWQLDYRHRPCNFVEILPRLEEHKRRK